MTKLSPYYFSSTDKDSSLTISYYPINQKWKLELIHKKKKIDYWFDINQVKDIRDLFIESVQQIEDTNE